MAMWLSSRTTHASESCAGARRTCGPCSTRRSAGSCSSWIRRRLRDQPTAVSISFITTGMSEAPGRSGRDGKESRRSRSIRWPHRAVARFGNCNIARPGATAPIAAGVPRCECRGCPLIHGTAEIAVADLPFDEAERWYIAELRRNDGVMRSPSGGSAAPSR